MKRHKFFKEEVSSDVICGNEIWIHRLQEAKNGCNICIVLANGCTASCVSKGSKYILGGRDVPDISMFRIDAEILAVYYLPTCRGLAAGSQELAEFLNFNSTNKEVWLIGHSKWADGLNDISNQLKEFKSDYASLDVVFVSPALGGSVFANEKLFKEHPKRCKLFMNVARMIGFKANRVELDVDPESEYIKQHSKVVKKPTKCYVTCLRQRNNLSLREKMYRIKDLEGLFNVLLDWAMYGGTDGIVSVSSQTRNVFLSRVKRIYSPHCHGLEAGCRELVKDFDHLS